MILVIGGMAQGKLAFAKSSLGVVKYDDGFIGVTDCIYNLQNAVMTDNFDEKLDNYIANHPDCVIICNEVGAGIVPLGENERAMREKTGRACCMLAQRAKAVYRVFCGLGMRIK